MRAADRDRLRAPPAGCAVRRSGRFGGARVAMHILWVKMNGLWPSTTGGRVRSLQIVSELARRHQVTVVTTHGPGDDPEGLKRQLSHCHEVVIVPLRAAEEGKRRVPGRRRAVVDVEIPGGSLEMARAAGAAEGAVARRQRQRSICASATFCLPQPTFLWAAPCPSCSSSTTSNT